MMRRVLFMLPIVIFTALVAFCAWRLILIARGDTPDLIPSVITDHPAPAFDLPSLLADQTGLKTSDLKGHVTLINFFASWCVPCRAEHPLLIGLKGKGAVLAGMAYKTKPDEAKAWLTEMGDPYDVIATDYDGRTAIDFGVYGVPETYLIDKKGIIRFKQTGPLTSEVIRDRLLPMIGELNQ
jgi:DsbE subfamily thiol:disulfide oxidoreductase